MSSLGKLMTGCAVVSSAVALAACGGSSSSTSTVTTIRVSKTVDIYSSLPLHGASRAQTETLVNGIRLALSQAGGKAGQFTVNYQSLDDSTAAAGAWDPNRTAANARKAAADSRTIYYIGEFNSGASEVSIPILNQAGIPQVSPANTSVGLTTNEPGSAVGEPGKYYPTGMRTFLRIIPNDSVQAAADLLALKQEGCTKVAVANDKEAYGVGLAKLLELEKGLYGVDIVSDTPIDPKAPNFHSYAATVKAERANCFEFAGIVANGGVEVTEAVHAALPTAKILGPDGMCTRSWTNPKDGGVLASIDPFIECTVPTLTLSAYPGGKAFVAAYKAKYGVSNPNPYAIFGYEAMKLGLDTIASLGSGGDDKSAVLRALFAIRDRNSVLGTYGFDKNGDTTLRSYGLYDVKNGDPSFLRTLTPAKVL
jgi:branched-chain amino acid transport system substrate-binding protein